MQYVRIGENLNHAKSALTVRQIGEHCIKKRLKALESKEEVPHDLLTLILRTVGKSQSRSLTNMLSRIRAVLNIYYIYTCIGRKLPHTDICSSHAHVDYDKTALT